MIESCGEPPTFELVNDDVNYSSKNIGISIQHAFSLRQHGKQFGADWSKKENVGAKNFVLVCKNFEDGITAGLHLSLSLSRVE